MPSPVLVRIKDWRLRHCEIHGRILKWRKTGDPKTVSTPSGDAKTVYNNQVDLEACKVSLEVKGRNQKHRYLIVVHTRKVVCVHNYFCITFPFISC